MSATTENRSPAIPMAKPLATGKNGELRPSALHIE